MITQIGIVAGEVWHYLEHCKKKDTLDNVAKAINKSKEVVLMSVGWLAREGHIILEGEVPNQSIMLRIVE